MSSRFAVVAGALLAAVVALPLSAQQSTVVAPRDTSTSAAKAPPPRTAASDSALVELGRALTQLAVTVQTAVQASAKNPELRKAALATAGQAVTVAQKSLAENTLDIERLLAEASKRLAAEEAKQKAKAAAAPSGH
ncbi:MAG TPA: hypothetical protein VGP25_17630 [Gemmatimonadaceae bacterium]|jgi:hypothetical protein|nr:hypothetical protein [Gemmatimonadaceae bacterium]